MILSIAVPAYNEAENIDGVVRELIEVLQPAFGASVELLLIDDGSSDATLEKMLQLEAAHAVVKVMQLKPNHGLGSAVWCGLRAAKGEWFTWIPADGQIPPESILKMFECTKQSQVVILRRYERSSTPIRRILSEIFHLLSRGHAGFDLHGFTGIWLCRTSLVQDIALRTSTAFQNILTAALACARTAAPAEIFTEVRKRNFGRSKVANLRTILMTFGDCIRLRNGTNPSASRPQCKT